MIHLPFVNKIKVFYPNFSPIMLTLPQCWKDCPLLAFVGCKNRASVRLVSMPGPELVFARRSERLERSRRSSKRMIRPSLIMSTKPNNLENEAASPDMVHEEEDESLVEALGPAGMQKVVP